MDLNPDVRDHAAPGVHFVLSPVTDLSACPDGSVGVVFTSNLFKHLECNNIVKCLREAARVLVPQGRFLILQPTYGFAVGITGCSSTTSRRWTTGACRKRWKRTASQSSRQSPDFYPIRPRDGCRTRSCFCACTCACLYSGALSGNSSFSPPRCGKRSRRAAQRTKGVCRERASWRGSTQPACTGMQFQVSVRADAVPPGAESSSASQ